MQRRLFCILGMLLLFFYAKSQSASQNSSVLIRGTVMSKASVPLVVVSVKAQYNNKTTTTDSEGEFELSILQLPDTITFSHVGYKTQRLVITEQALNLIIHLEELRESLNEVIVSTGYQKISKERMVGAFSQLDSAAYARQAGMGILERLEANIPGFVVNKKTDHQFLIRGVSSLGKEGTSLKPLIILDDFPFDGDLSSINPNDVLSIEVLKDAAAASIWGARAGNGVIVINTKKSKFNQPTQVTANVNAKFKAKPNLFYFPTLSSSEFIDIEKMLYSKGHYRSVLNNTTTRPIVSPVVELLNRQEKGLINEDEAAQLLATYATIDTRQELLDHVYRIAQVLQNNLTLSGGNQMMSNYISLSYDTESSEYQRGKGANQVTAQWLTQFKPIPAAQLDFGLYYSRNTNKRFALPSLPSIPYLELLAADGSPAFIPKDIRMGYLDTAGGGHLLDWQYRPLEEIDLADNKVIHTNLKANASVAYRLRPWLQVVFKGQYMQANEDNRRHYSLETYFTRNMINRFSRMSGTTIQSIIPKGGILDIRNGKSSAINLRSQLNIDQHWQDHTITGLLAVDYATGTSGIFSALRYYGYNAVTGTFSAPLNYDSSYVQYGRLSGAQRIAQQTNLQEGTINRMLSFTSNVSYTYAGKYTVYGSARRDGSNVFGVRTNNRWKPLWSTGVSWHLYKEPFFQSQWMNQLTIRGSFGYSGNVNNTLSGLATMLYTGSANYTGLQKAQVGAAPNPDLRWEQVRTMNGGVDFSMLHNRISGSLDVYSKYSTDIIAPIPFDPTTGINLFTVNAASIKGHGYELQLHSKNTTRLLKWNTSLGVAYNKSIVDKVYNGGYRAIDFITFGMNPSEGKVAYGISSLKWGGLDPDTGHPIGYFDGKPSTNYAAIFNDSIQNQQLHGSSLPLLTTNLLNSVSYKNLSLSFNLKGSFNYYFRQPSIDYASLIRGNTNREYLNRWQATGDELTTHVPSFVYPVQANRDQFYNLASIHVLKGDHIRLQDVRLSYAMNKKSVNGQVYIYASNLNVILWKKADTPFDPEFSGGVSTYSYPSAASVVIGFNLQF